MVGCESKISKGVQRKEEIWQKRKSPEFIPEQLKPQSNEMDPFVAILSSSLSKPCIERDAALLGNARLSHPVNTGQKTRIMNYFQQNYGNTYVQCVLALARDVAEGGILPEIEQTIQHARSGGQALDSNIRAQMESVFGADFGDVRVHTNTEADALSRALNARAFTTGKDIFFRQGSHSPGDSSGRELLAHELTHVVQQSSGGTTLLINRQVENIVGNIVDWAKEAKKSIESFYTKKVQDLQGKINDITDKAKSGKKLTEEDIAFLKSLYQAMVIGGYVKGYPEAAELMSHYLGKSGEKLEISYKIYQDSKIVQNEIKRQKSLIKKDANNGKLDQYSKLQSDVLYADYERLKKADHRFILKSASILRGGRVGTVYTVDNKYQFTDFKTGYYTDLTLWGQTLKIEDGLSRYLVGIGLAAEFPYYATWWEIWDLSSEK